MFANKFYLNILLCFCLIFSGNHLQAQRIDSMLNIWGTKYPQEKIHLHFDKNYYHAGETIWFKAYLVADNPGEAISKSMYAELLDDTGAVLQRKMMPVQESGAAADFKLPDTIAANHLFVRAYTSWMLNFDSSLLYLKPVQIIRAKAVAESPAAALAYQLHFFPEGGNLVNGISSNIAFKATDNRGMPVFIAGNIVDSKGQKITAFSAEHDGMGYFTMQPEAGEKYRAIWKDKENETHESLLPEARTQGIVLSTQYSGNKLYYTVTRPDIVDESRTAYYVLAQMHQKMVYSARIKLSKKASISAPIETDSLGNGVLQLTVFDGNDLPVAERLVFIDHNYSFTTGLHVTDKNPDKRGRYSLLLDLKDTLSANLSISVTDADVNPVTENEENIYSKLLLSSDLKGFIFNPAYYFSGDADSIKKHLDLVMMTNGWRRFRWENILAGNWPLIKNTPKNYLSISGKITGLSPKKLHNKTLTGIVRTEHNGSTVLNFPLSDQGEFGQDGLFFFDTARVFYQINNDRNKFLTGAAVFEFRDNFVKAPLQSAAMLSALYLPPKTAATILQKTTSLQTMQNMDIANRDTKTLETVQLKTRVKSQVEKMNEAYTYGAFGSDDGYTFFTANDSFAKVSPNVLFYLSGRAMGGLEINMQGTGGASWHGAPTAFFLNEDITPAEMLKSINMSEVAMIKIFRPPFYGRLGSGAGGAVAIYTRTKKAIKDNSDLKGLPYAVINGYSVTKEFYAPDYEKKPEPEAKDYRTTLYWNPHLYFDKNTRQVTIPFFNSDHCKKIRVTVEGINEAGLLTSKEMIIE